MTRLWDGGTDRRSDPTPRPAFAGKNIPTTNQVSAKKWTERVLS